MTATTITTNLATAVLEAAQDPGRPGTVYLLHFDRPYKHAAHYTGWTTNLPDRLWQHEIGRGARLMEVVLLAGIGWQLARTWDADRAFERRLKNRHGASKYCPICRDLRKGGR